MSLVRLSTLYLRRPGGKAWRVLWVGVRSAALQRVAWTPRKALFLGPCALPGLRCLLPWCAACRWSFLGVVCAGVVCADWVCPLACAVVGPRFALAG